MTEAQRTKQFYDLLWPHRALLLRTALILTNNSPEAEDLAQETLLKAFRALDRFTPGTNIVAWLLTILRNTRIDRLRAAGLSLQNTSLDQSDIDPPDLRPDSQLWSHPQDLLNSFSDQQIIDALQQLPEDIRWTLLLLDVEAFDHASAARLLNVPVGTIKSRAHRGRAMLRQSLLPLAHRLRLPTP